MYIFTPFIFFILVFVIQNMTYELALMKAGKGKVAGVSGLDDGPPAGRKDDAEEE